MKIKELELYEELSKIKKLNGQLYSELLSKYDEETVKKVIEDMIDEDDENLNKFDYYISKICYVDDRGIYKDLYSAYTSDLSLIPLLSREDNIKLATEIYYIIQELNLILDELGFGEMSSFWISDKVEMCMEKCNDNEKLKELNKLYKKFLYKRDMLVEGNLKWVISVAKKYYTKNIDFNEIIQLGNVGLMKACEKYDPSFNTCFSTYSYHWIRQNITRELAQISCPVSIPVGLYAFNLSVKKCMEVLRRELRREPSVEEIAEYIGNVDGEKIRLTLQTFSETVSLNEPVSTSADDDEFTIMDSVVDENSNIFDQITKIDLSTEMMELLKRILTEREFAVLCRRYGLDDCPFQRLQQIGDTYGLSRERIRQIESKAIKKIRRKGKYLVEYLK